MELDHLILAVNDLDASVQFFTDVLGLGYEGMSDPFTVIRVGPKTTSRGVFDTVRAPNKKEFGLLLTRSGFKGAWSDEKAA